MRQLLYFYLGTLGLAAAMAAYLGVSVLAFKAWEAAFGPKFSVLAPLAAYLIAAPPIVWAAERATEYLRNRPRKVA